MALRSWDELEALLLRIMVFQCYPCSCGWRSASHSVPKADHVLRLTDMKNKHVCTFICRSIAHCMYQQQSPKLDKSCAHQIFTVRLLQSVLRRYSSGTLHACCKAPGFVPSPSCSFLIGCKTATTPVRLSLPPSTASPNTGWQSFTASSVSHGFFRRAV